MLEIAGNKICWKLSKFLALSRFGKCQINRITACEDTKD